MMQCNASECLMSWQMLVENEWMTEYFFHTNWVVVLRRWRGWRRRRRLRRKRRWEGVEKYKIFSTFPSNIHNSIALSLPPNPLVDLFILIMWLWLCEVYHSHLSPQRFRKLNLNLHIFFNFFLIHVSKSAPMPICELITCCHVTCWIQFNPLHIHTHLGKGCLRRPLVCGWE